MTEGAIHFLVSISLIEISTLANLKPFFVKFSRNSAQQIRKSEAFFCSMPLCSIFMVSPPQVCDTWLSFHSTMTKNNSGNNEHGRAFVRIPVSSDSLEAFSVLPYPCSNHASA
jgi:hypothetical protein